MHLAGLSGMARRVPEFADYFLPFVTVGLNGTILLIISTLIFIRSYYIYLYHINHSNYMSIMIILILDYRPLFNH